MVRTVKLVRLFPVVLLLGATLLAPLSPRPAAAAANIQVLRSHIADFLAEGMTDYLGEGDQEVLEILRRVYSEHQMRPFWMTADGPSPQGQALLDALQSIEEDGLNPSDYGVTFNGPFLSSDLAEAFAELDIRLSIGVIQAASDLSNGRVDPASIDSEIFIKARKLDREGILRAALEASDLRAYLLGFRPRDDDYRRLRAALVRYRKIETTGGWPMIPEFRYELGSKSPNVAILRRRLSLSGDIPENAPVPEDPQIFDETLLRGLESFQRRHGLVASGRTDYPTLDALNMPVQRRIQQIILNLERHRWMPSRTQDRYLLVNLAGFELKVIEEGHTIFTTEVVVGAPYHRTPVFSDEIRYLVFNPYWNVPRSIVTEEFLPELRQNPYYLDDEDYELLAGWTQDSRKVDPMTINWDEVTPEGFRWRIRQRPGPKNALGDIKFMFPNKHDIYLHGTPKMELFDHNARAFSHGCIRVKDPVSLAQILLRGKEGWDRSRIVAEIEDDRVNNEVVLAKPMPVHLYYLTSWADQDGAVHFREDIYQRDQLLARALFGPRNLASQG